MIDFYIETKLLSLSKQLHQNGFEKEAGLLDSFRMKALSGLAALTVLTGISQIDALNLPYEVISSANNISANADTKEIVLTHGESLMSICEKYFPNAEYPEKLALMILNQNPHIKGIDDKVSIDTKIIIQDYNKIHNSLNLLLKTNGLIPIDNASLSDAAIEHIISVEKMARYAYDDARPSVKWKPGLTAIGNWTIGYGHLLTNEEIKSGVINSDRNSFNWKNGLSANDAKDIFIKDLSTKEMDVQQILKKTGYSFITQSKFDALVDFAYNSGRRSLFNVLSKTKSLNDLPSDLAKYKIDNHSYGGLYSRRISQILKMHNIYLSKDDIDRLTLKIGGFDSIKNPDKMRNLLRIISESNGIKSANDLKPMIELVANQ